MENPTPAGVIDISDDVVKRLKAGISQQGKKPTSIREYHPEIRISHCPVLCNNCPNGRLFMPNTVETP